MAEFYEEEIDNIYTAIKQQKDNSADGNCYLNILLD